MPQVVIENPILNSPFAEPTRHFKFTDDGQGPDDPLNLILEVTGEKKKDKAAKVATARTLRVPAINNHGGFGRCEFLEIADPRGAARTIRPILGGSPMRRMQP